MKKLGLIAAAILIIGIVIFVAAQRKEGPKDQSTLLSMKLLSSAFSNNGQIPQKYTCDGENVSPPLSFTEVPEKVMSFVLIVDDPDAPGGDWVHWVVWNIPSQTREIAENSVPEGATQEVTDFDNNAYGGPCPPSGTHRYFFKLYALDTKLDLPNSSKKISLEEIIKDHVLAQATLIGLYARK